MNHKTFERLLATYGADPQRWPADLRADAEALLQHLPEARARQAEGRRLDALLDLATPVIASGQVDRVVEQALAAIRFLPQDRPQLHSAWLPGLRAATARWLSAGVLSGAVAAGLASGFLLRQPSVPGAAAVAIEEAESAALSLIFARSASLYAETER